MRLPIRCLAILALVAPPLAAQPTSRTLIPASPTAAPTAPALSRFEILARSIDSASKVAESMQIAAADRQRAAQETNRILFLSTMVSGFGHRSNWMNAATAVGMSQLFGSLKGNGQMMGFAGLTGGASWLLSTLVPHQPLHFAHFRNVRIAK